jgi:hypothetical protein
MVDFTTKWDFDKGRISIQGRKLMLFNRCVQSAHNPNPWKLKRASVVLSFANHICPQIERSPFDKLNSGI